MILIKNVSTLEKTRIDLSFDSEKDILIDGSDLMVLPAVIDPHVHFRMPGGEHKENWITGSNAAIAGGVTTVFDMPNTLPPSVTRSRLIEKRKMVDNQLLEADIPLRYGLYLGADDHYLNEIEKMGDESIGLKIFMGCSTNDLCLAPESFEEAFKNAAKAKKVVAVHAEDENMIREGKKRHAGVTDPSIHSKVRSRETAVKATEKAIELSIKTGATLYLLHISTKEELEIVKKAKKSGAKVFVEATPHHLYLNHDDYAKFGTLIQVNPPMRTQEDNEALWEGIVDGTVDTIGSDHAPHLLSEKNEGYGKSPSGVSGVETLLPLMLHAVNQGRLSLQRLIELTRTNIEKIFSLSPQNDLVLVNLNLYKKVNNKELKTKCGWSPFHGMILKGWPVYTVCRDKLYPASGVNLGKLEEKQLKELNQYEFLDSKVQGVL